MTRLSKITHNNHTLDGYINIIIMNNGFLGRESTSAYHKCRNQGGTVGTFPVLLQILGKDFSDINSVPNLVLLIPIIFPMLMPILGMINPTP